MESFTNNSVTYTLIERTYHREHEGGYEKWMFEIEGKKFYIDSDIRFLPKCSSKVMIVDFYSEDSYNSGIWETTNTMGYQAQHVLSSIVELIVKRLPTFRHYRYLAFPCPPKWNFIITNLINKYGQFANKEVVEEIEEVLNYDLSVLIDAGYYTCYVGKITKF